MRYVLSIAFFFCSFVSEGQIESLFINRINNTNDKVFLNQLKRISEQKNIDSAFEATRIINDLSDFDSKIYNATLLQPILNQVDSFSLNFYQQTIKERWKSEALGSNWGGKIINPGKKLVFTDSEAFFYERDLLIRNATYSIVGESQKHNDLVFKRFVICFSDTKEEWAFYFITKGHGTPFHGIAKKLYLLFNKEPFCVCGCPEELYSIETISVYQ